MKTIGIFLKYEVIGEGEEGKHRVFLHESVLFAYFGSINGAVTAQILVIGHSGKWEGRKSGFTTPMSFYRRSSRGKIGGLLLQ
jgi:hypothetical protein